MYCHKCGFITKGPEERCPYCGSPFSSPSRLDDKRFLFRWAEISIRQVINILLFNLFAAFVIVDVCLIFVGPKINYHLSPWSFLAVFSAFFFFNEVIAPKRKKNNFVFPQAFALSMIFSFILMLSYPSWESDMAEALLGMSSFHFCFGYFYPSVILLLFLCGAVRFLLLQNYNVFSTFFYVLILAIFAAILFGFTFVDQFGIGGDIVAKILNYCCFGFTVLFSLNSAVLGYLRMKSRFATKG